MYACSGGHKDVVKLLLEQSVEYIDFNAISNAGGTAFIFACRNGRTDLVRLLLKHAKAKDIEIPKNNCWFSFSVYKEIEDLVQKFHM